MTHSPQTPEQREQRAKKRFFLLAFLRFMGVGIALFGIMIAAGRMESIPDENRLLIGSFFILAGVVETLWIPLAMARAWRSNDE